MLKIALIMISLLVLNLPVFTQTAKYSTPTVWETYLVKDKNVSVLMPKLPVYLNNSNICRGEENSMFFAYSDGVVYVLAVTSKVKVPAFCPQKKNFDKENFNERVEILKNQNKTAKITEIGNEITLVDEDKTFKFTNDYDNKRWFELQVFGANQSKPEVENFFGSLKIEKQLNGKKIGKGALRNYGDENTAAEEKIEPDINSAAAKNLEAIAENLKIIIKPRASYTDAARQANIQGTVRLKVTFLANGGIGSIEPISTLPYGLTEQSVAAAAKIFFIPMKKNGVPFSVSKIVEYNFAIY